MWKKLINYLDNYEWFLKLARPFIRVGWYLGQLREKLDFWFGGKHMTRIAVVGDLSLQDPARLEQVMAVAYNDCDLLVQVGDMHPGYSVVQKYASMGQKSVYAVQGNHDTQWDTALTWPKQWRHDIPGAHLIGLDNCMDSFSQADWDTVASFPQDSLPVIVFVHKPLSTIVLLARMLSSSRACWLTGMSYTFMATTTAGPT